MKLFTVKFIRDILVQYPGYPEMYPGYPGLESVISMFSIRDIIQVQYPIILDIQVLSIIRDIQVLVSEISRFSIQTIQVLGYPRYLDFSIRDIQTFTLSG